MKLLIELSYLLPKPSATFAAWFRCLMMNEAMHKAMQPLNQVINAAAKASRMHRDLKNITFWHCQIAGAKSLDRTKNQY